EDIAEYTLQTKDAPLASMESLNSLSDAVIVQVNSALDAFSRGDVDTALTTVENDRRVHKLFHAMQREHLSYMIEDPRCISSGIMAMNIGRSLERIAGHATNIAEMAIYMVQGHDIRHVDHDEAARIVRDGDDED
ncbi:MAG: PhoU domain-containing protein, partial [Mariprofundaceae bacterium]|nr:PhoU domain-containing protein [Mariprofundaceae bacterium]